MTRWVFVGNAPEEADSGALIGEVAASPGVWECSAGPDLPGSTGGRGMTWDVIADSPPTSQVVEQLQAELLPLLPLASHETSTPGPRVKRTLLLNVREGTSADVRTRFEADLIAMPNHISTIRSWALSRIDQSMAGASSRWTHAWEQEFDDVEGLTGEYLLHPYHWTHVDRWFDPEAPESIVEPDLANLYRWAVGPVIGKAGQARA